MAKIRCTGPGVAGQREGAYLGQKGVVGVVGDKKCGLLGRGHFRSRCGRSAFAGQQALVGSLAQLPEQAGHGDGGQQQEGKEDFMMAGNHGWRPSVRHSRSPAARASATRTWYCGLSRSAVILWSASRSGATSTATAGQAMLSTVTKAVRPRVTVMPALRRAELSTPARARLRVVKEIGRAHV